MISKRDLQGRHRAFWNLSRSSFDGRNGFRSLGQLSRQTFRFAANRPPLTLFDSHLNGLFERELFGCEPGDRAGSFEGNLGDRDEDIAGQTFL